MKEDPDVEKFVADLKARVDDEAKRLAKEEIARLVADDSRLVPWEETAEQEALVKEIVECQQGKRSE